MLVAPGDDPAGASLSRLYSRNSTLGGARRHPDASRARPAVQLDDSPRRLFASYSGVLGGAERVLLDCATRLQRPSGRLPGGPLAELRAAADRACPDHESARWSSACAHAPGLARAGARPRRLEPDSSSPGARGGAGGRARARPVARRPSRPARASRRARAPSAADQARADGVAAASQAIARQFAAAGAPPRRRPRRVHPAPAPRRALRTRWCSARSSAGSGRIWRSRSPTDAGAARHVRRGAAARRRRPDRGRAAAERGRLDGRVTIAGPSPTCAPRWPTPTCCCTAPTPSPTASCWSRRSPPAGRSSRPPRAGPLEIVTGGAGRLYPPGNADAAAAALRAVLADGEAPFAARRRAEAFDVRDSAARFEAALGAAMTDERGAGTAHGRRRR